MWSKQSIILLISLFGFLSTKAQDKSNRGKEFWLGYGYHWLFLNPDITPVNSQEMALYISAEQAANVTVSINGTSWSQTLSIPANTVDASVLIPKTGVNDARLVTDGLSTKGIHIVSDVPVAVYAHVYVNQGSGATMLMPVETYGYSYYSVNYSQATSGSVLPNISPTTQNGPDWYSWFYVIASENNTRVEITPSDTTKNGWLPGQTYTVDLNKGEIFNVFGKMVPGNSQAWAASKDMTGSKIKSVIGSDGNCHPMAVFSGSGGIRICRGDGGEYLQQQVFPAQAWGTRYLTYHTINNTNTDILETNRNYYRVCTADPTAVVKRNGVTLTGLVNNFYYEFQDSTGGDYIESDKPILVSQYTVNDNQCWNFPTTSPSPPSNGDPEMFYLSPIEQGQKSVRFFASRQSPAIAYVYTNIVLPTAGVPSLRVDGTALPSSQIIPHPNYPSYSVALARFIGPAAQHTIVSDSAFNATVYGLGNYESYGYNVGTLINNLNNYSAIQNTMNTSGNVDTFTCPKTPVRLFVKLGHPANSIHWKLSTVPGIFPNTDSVISSPVPLNTEIINGRTYYIYTLQQDFTFATPGTYNIPVSYSATVIENCNQTENANLKVVVKPGPVSDFSFQNLCFRDTTRFTGTPTAGIFNLVNYRWDFHDLTSQMGLTAKKLYPATGNYDVRFRVYADNGCIGDTIKTININSGTVPTLTITIAGKPCVDSVMNFTSSIVPNASNPATWYWDFGDGQTFTSTSSHTATHSYSPTATGVTVKHLVTLTTGCSPDTARQTIPFIYNNPMASFAIIGDTLCAKTPVLFTSPGTGITAWKWNFGNGTGVQVPPFNYAYNSAGTFDISLTVTDANGCGSAPANDRITINPAPPINAGPDKFFSFGQSTAIDATITNPANYTYVWSPASSLSSATVLNPVSSAEVSTTYTIEATDKINFCKAKDIVVITPVSKLYVPNAFTPNNDGKNDKWVIPGLALYPEARVSIYNKGGFKIFEAKGYISRPWDGTFKGVAQPNEAYVYMIELNDDKKQLLKGTVVIIR